MTTRPSPWTPGRWPRAGRESTKRRTGGPMPTRTEAPPGVEKETALDLYRRMAVIRRCEEQLARAHQRGLIHGACHTYVGQEAIAAGVCAHLRRDDVVFSTHRGHGHALAKGVP